MAGRRSAELLSTVLYAWKLSYRSSTSKLAGLENATRSSSRPKSLTADAQTITGRSQYFHLLCKYGSKNEHEYFFDKKMCLHQRVRRRRRVKEEEEVLDKWTRDVCSGEELPEVEIFSLLEEQIPKYKLRADTLTSFAGYENKDWYIPSPALKPEEIDTPLTPEQIRETLNYFCEQSVLFLNWHLRDFRLDAFPIVSQVSPCMLQPVSLCDNRLVRPMKREGAMPGGGACPWGSSLRIPGRQYRHSGRPGLTDRLSGR
ncbi:unnamed protein product [Nesidiocoris tenuis]|uniref:HAP1 N-terminal domain-containing protein n=1 Tax=Nesidiocoris tenuis TaxID=355587 RepID=A0A6H5H0H1_9HEMI|nr:unnamed protein product [Nesidiocoris tenuis]